MARRLLVECLDQQLLSLGIPFLLKGVRGRRDQRTVVRQQRGPGVLAELGVAELFQSVQHLRLFVGLKRRVLLGQLVRDRLVPDLYEQIQHGIAIAKFPFELFEQQRQRTGILRARQQLNHVSIGGRVLQMNQSVVHGQFLAPLIGPVGERLK